MGVCAPDLGLLTSSLSLAKGDSPDFKPKVENLFCELDGGKTEKGLDWRPLKACFCSAYGVFGWMEDKKSLSDTGRGRVLADGLFRLLNFD